MLRDGIARRANFDRRLVLDRREARFTCELDAESERFEEELRARLVAARPPSDDPAAPTECDLPLFQRHAWLRGSCREYRLLQVRDPSGAPAMQLAVRIDRPRLVQRWGMAVVPRLGCAVSPEEEAFGLQALRALCHDAGDVITVRLQPYRTSAVELRNFEARARRAGYALCDPLDVTRTLLLDLHTSAEAHLAALSKKTRAKVNHRSRSTVELRVLTERSHIPAARAAVNASMRRTGGAASSYDFDAAFALAARDPGRARILGLFLSARPQELLAYVVGLRHGAVAEYSSAGSIDDPALRQLPFNYFLLWELASWARAEGARWLDLGGVTDGDAVDPRAGISSFKRHFGDREVELGRELLAVIHPGRRLLYETLRDWKHRMAASAPRPTSG
jgi:hypothetical protein